MKEKVHALLGAHSNPAPGPGFPPPPPVPAPGGPLPPPLLRTRWTARRTLNASMTMEKKSRATASVTLPSGVMSVPGWGLGGLVSTITSLPRICAIPVTISVAVRGWGRRGE